MLPGAKRGFSHFNMSGLTPPRSERWILIGIFLAALIFHFLGLTLKWKASFMAGHEFRQAQTAITSYYIDQENNFSLLYETPILGKPWVSILMEVPVYEWSVVVLSRATGWPHYVAARTISATCFYLMLPAVYLLLGRFRLPARRRLLVLALILTCPVYIYYSRAFLMDSMELMCCAWFLVGFVRTMDERRWRWLALAMVAGTGAALIKSATLAVWLIPAAGYGGWMLWRDIRAQTGWRTPVKTCLWGLATVAVGLGLLRAWIAYTDPIKAAHPSAWIFTAKNLSQGNWGLFNLRPLFSKEVWNDLWACWDEAIMSRWLIAAGLIAGLSALPAVRGRVAAIGAVFFLAQFMFPLAYAYQDYYFYACAIFLNVAFGFLLIGLLDSRAPRWLCGVLLLVPLVAQGTAYWRGYRPVQAYYQNGGYPFTDVIRDLTPRNSVIVVAGADWAAMTPLYAQRKALMVRNGLEYDDAYLQRAFADLADEDVCAIVVWNDVRRNRHFIELAASRFDIDPTAPTYSHPVADVYMVRTYMKGVRVRLKTSRKYPEVTVPPDPSDAFNGKGRLKIPPQVARNAFPNITPGPYQVEFQYGLSWLDRGSSTVLSAHPDSDLWLHPPPEAGRISWSFGIMPGAYEPEGKTNGVEFIVEGELPDGTSRLVYRRVLDPRENPRDRGEQYETIPYVPRPGEALHFSTRPNGNSAFDWAYWTRIMVK
jgi:hypothetical protein